LITGSDQTITATLEGTLECFKNQAIKAFLTVTINHAHKTNGSRCHAMHCRLPGDRNRQGNECRRVLGPWLQARFDIIIRRYSREARDERTVVVVRLRISSYSS
jgi:hypothetical protein